MAINQYTQALQTLSQPAYTPVPFQEMMQMGQYIQKRYDDSLLGQDEQLMKSAATDVIPDENVKKFLDNKIASFRTQQSELLDKYKGKTYSSDFQRESRKLIAQMAGDSDIKALQQYKMQYDLDDKYAAELRAKGVSFYDPRLNGQKYVDETGNLTPYKAGVRTLAHDEMIDEQGAKILQAMVQTGATTNNFKQLDEAYKASIQPNSKILQDKVAQLMQSGMNRDEATKSAKVYIKDRFDSFRKQDIDPGMLEYYAKQLERKKKDPLQPAITTGGYFKAGAREAREDYFTDLNNLIDNIDSNGTFTTQSKVSQWRTMVGGAAAMGKTGNTKDANFNIASKQVADKMTADAVKYFGNAYKKYKNKKDMLVAYRDSMKDQYGAGLREAVKYVDPKKNEAMMQNLRGVNLPIFEMDKDGKRIGSMEESIGVLGKYKDNEIHFAGISDFDPAGKSNASFKITTNDGKTFSMTIPEGSAYGNSFALTQRLGSARQYTGPVSSTSTNILPRDYWVTKPDQNGNPVTYVPVRNFTKDGKPSLQVYVVPGATSDARYTEIDRTVATIQKDYNAGSKNAAQLITTPSALMNSELENFYTVDMADIDDNSK